MEQETINALFVDSETQVLRGYRRSLHSMGRAWKFHTADSGHEALNILNSTSINVIISEIHLEDMPGTLLLEQVREKHPQILRIALTGQVEQEAMLRSSDLVHVYLAKPCPADVLSTALKNAVNMQSNLENDRLKTLISQMETIPSLPTLYNEILEKLRSPNSSAQEVGKIISQDIAMTTKILKLVNSAFYGLRKYVSDPVRAVIYMGMDTVKNLVLALHAFSQFEGGQVAKELLDMIWHHSLATGSLAKQFATMENATKQIIDDCFVSGLLHDVGKLILAVNLPDDYRKMIQYHIEAGISQTAAEQKIFGTDHAMIGGYLLRLWGIPNPIVEAVAYHENPRDRETSSLTPLVFVYAADRIHQYKRSNLTEATAREIDRDYLAKFGLEERLNAWQKVRIEDAEQP